MKIELRIGKERTKYTVMTDLMDLLVRNRVILKKNDIWHKVIKEISNLPKK